MKYSIFHTSHCGSTLLITLLKNHMKTYAEPPWSSRVDMRYIFSAQDNTIVKYPSAFSVASRILPGKKVFLYRRLRDHLEKITSNNLSMQKHLKRYYTLRSIRNLFPNLIVDSDLKKLAFVWAHANLDINFAQNVLSIDANDFFLEPVVYLRKVTNFFGIDPVKDYEPLKFYVKKDFLGKEAALNEINPTEKIPFNIRDGYIKSKKFFDIEDWVNEKIFTKISLNEIFPLFRDKDGKPIYSFYPGKTIKFDRNSWIVNENF